jgi:hypothetical protein
VWLDLGQQLFGLADGGPINDGQVNALMRQPTGDGGANATRARDDGGAIAEIQHDGF